MLKVVKAPMKNNYHYFFILNDLVPGHVELIELTPFFSDDNNDFSDVLSFLDQQHFDINKSIINELVEYAGRQFKDYYDKSR